MILGYFCLLLEQWAISMGRDVMGVSAVYASMIGHAWIFFSSLIISRIGQAFQRLVAYLVDMSEAAIVVAKPHRRNVWLHSINRAQDFDWIWYVLSSNLQTDSLWFQLACWFFLPFSLEIFIICKLFSFSMIDFRSSALKLIGMSLISMFLFVLNLGMKTVKPIFFSSLLITLFARDPRNKGYLPRVEQIFFYAWVFYVGLV